MVQKQHEEAIIREVTTKDEGELMEFLERNDVYVVTRHFNPFPLTKETAHKIACGEHKDRYYIALQGKIVVGICMLRGWDEGFTVPSFGILVDKEYQGRGLGKRMTILATEEAGRLGCTRVRLSVYNSNLVGKKLYQKLGFREVERKEAIVYGEKDESIIMIKDLKS